MTPVEYENTSVHACWSNGVVPLPAEVEQRSGGGGDAVSRPAQQVELRQGSGLLRLDVLQVEAAHQEVLTPDVL